MYLIISGILQFIIVVLLIKSIDKLRERIVNLEEKKEVLEDKVKSLQDKLDSNRKDEN